MKGLNQQRGLSFVGLMALVCVPLGYLVLARLGVGFWVYAAFTAGAAYLLWPRASGNSAAPQPLQEQPPAYSPPAPPSGAVLREGVVGVRAAQTLSGGLWRLPHFVGKLAERKRNGAEVAKRHLTADLTEFIGAVQAMSFVRSVEIYGESLGIINDTKNIETLRSRAAVALQKVAELTEEFPAIMAPLAAAMLEDVRAAAGDRLALLAEEKVTAQCAKALAAKTQATRDKYAAAAAAKAEDFIGIGYMTPEQVSALRLALHRALSAQAPASGGAAPSTVVQP